MSAAKRIMSSAVPSCPNFLKSLSVGSRRSQSRTIIVGPIEVTAEFRTPPPRDETPSALRSSWASTELKGQALFDLKDEAQFEAASMPATMQAFVNEASGALSSRQSPGSLAIADRCVTSTLGLLLAWASGLWWARLPIRLPWRITSFFQGAMIGLGVFTVVLVTFNYSGQAQLSFTPGQFVCLLVLGLAICPLLGGTAVFLLRSQRDSEGSVNRPQRWFSSVCYGKAWFPIPLP